MTSISILILIHFVRCAQFANLSPTANKSVDGATYKSGPDKNKASDFGQILEIFFATF